MYVTNNGTYSVSIDNTTANNGDSSTWLTVSNLTVGAGSGLPTMLINFTNTARTLSVGQLAVIGANQNGSMIVSNGTIFSRLMTVGTGSGAQGMLNVYGGLVRVTNNATANSLVLGETAGSTGTVLLAGGTIAVTNTVNVKSIIGNSGYGRVVVSNGGAFYATSEQLGVSSGGYGEIDILRGGTNSFTTSGNNGIAEIGVAGTGLILVDGGVLQAVNARVRFGDGGQGTLIVSNGLASFQGAGATFQLGGVPASKPGSATWQLVGGTTTVSYTSIAIGAGDATHKGKATILVDGGFFDASGTTTAQLGNSGSLGAITISNGTMLANNLSAGALVNGTGTVTVAGGALIATNAGSTATIEIGAVGVGTMTMSAGTITADRLIATNGSNSTINFFGGTLNLGMTTVSNGSTFVVGNGTSTARLNLQGGTHTFDAGLNLNTNATLSGSGFSTLSLGGNLTLASNSTVVVDLMTNTVTGFDRMFVTGTVSLAESILSLRITNYIATVGTQFTLIDNDGTNDLVTGFFRGLTNNAFIDASANGQDAFFRILYNGGDGNDVVLLAAVPEPSSLWLALGAAVVIGRLRGRQSGNRHP